VDTADKQAVLIGHRRAEVTAHRTQVAVPVGELSASVK
jgi:hypothetical protein